ncbi:hypothetical protein A3H03_01135 [Candidatus Kuenenbacteria bacterium RIFCSPLOWO2_12_FULL_42_13]|uniref:Uncharacterized protein n=2 Tax=Candidatus Kueneniibacteriota TaxID=1752740 RepID=A0A0G1B7M6_9BACT|nr:MAG: hypothetical protein UV02_C0019G0010 [Candidatus Kuenenbacteria bacterium GW2011_GWA2_42_15]OGG92095.1 MAG: hypothetical protein A3H03_01135 [Candidatus Kuenenbacteria bacterium RIFCSPLOWO2_12_FULL_42_13]
MKFKSRIYKSEFYFFLIFGVVRCKFFISIFIGLNFVLLLRKFDFCFGFWAEGLGVNAPKPRLLVGI